MAIVYVVIFNPHRLVNNRPGLAVGQSLALTLVPHGLLLWVLSVSDWLN